MVTTTMPSAGGAQETTCLRLDLVNGWLFTIDEGSPAGLQPAPEVVGVVHQKRTGARGRAVEPPARRTPHGSPGCSPRSAIEALRLGSATLIIVEGRADTAVPQIKSPTWRLDFA